MDTTIVEANTKIDIDIPIDHIDLAEIHEHIGDIDI